MRAVFALRSIGQVFTDVMVGGPAMGDEQSQEGGYNASLKNKAEAAAARGENVKQDGAGLMVVGPLMSSVALRQVRNETPRHRTVAFIV